MSFAQFKGHPIVTGFRPTADGAKGPAELSGRIKKGDILVAINGVSVLNMEFGDVIQIIRGLSSPFCYFRFLRWAFYEDRRGG
jgi:hypothetical protein